MDESQTIELIWGCDPSRQFEMHWLLHLLHPSECEQINSFDRNLTHLNSARPRILVESGLMLLEQSVSKERIAALQALRKRRLQILSDSGPFLLIHFSDEEGLDGDQLYPMLPDGSCVWRNFPYRRFDRAGLVVRSFPIGPRGEFLGNQPSVLSSIRHFPWAFMGTIWRSGQRFLATSLFLRALPQGIFFGGKSFGQGIPLEKYKHYLLQSIFSLCPEGDRHFDTFRLFESLQMGCLPLVVERYGQARQVLGHDFPLPIFARWSEALSFAQLQLSRPEHLNHLQALVNEWWQSRKASLSVQLHRDLLNSWHQ